MSTNTNKWTKTELQTYILLLCADADAVLAEEEINLIKSKISADVFKKIYSEFNNDNKDKRLEKIEDNVRQHKFSTMELGELRKDMYAVFFADSKYKNMERNLDRILDNILY